MTNQEIQLENRKLDIEEKKLQFEKDKLTKENSFSLKQIGIIITSIVSIATIIVSVFQYRIARDTNQKELALSEQQLELAQIEDNRRYSLDLTKFISENHDKIFSSDTNEQALMRDVMIVSFPSDINEIVFRKIKSTKKTKSSKLVWEEGEKQVDIIINESIDEYKISENESIDYYISLLNYPKREVRRKATEILVKMSTKTKHEVINKLLDNIYPDDKKYAYRVNFNIAFTLYKMPMGWDADKQRKDRLLKLKNSVNYSDYHFKKYVDLAINNIRSD